MYKKLLVVLFSLSIVGCDSNRQSSLKDVRLALAMQPSNGLTMVALDQGFFKAQGLNVTVSEHPSGKRAMQDALLAGKADIASSADVPIVKNAFVSKEVVTIATAFSADNVNRIIARLDSGIKEPKDLIGKHIATQKASAVHFFMHLFLLKHGLSEEKIEISYMKAEQLPKALAAGKMDAFSMREPYISHAKELLGDNAIVFSAPGVYRQVENVITTREYLSQFPMVLEAYIQALLDAEQFVHNQPEAAQKIIASRLKVPVKQIKENWASYQFNLALEQSSIILMEDIARWLKYNKIVDSPKIPNFMEHIDTNSLEKHNAQAVTVIQ